MAINRKKYNKNKVLEGGRPTWVEINAEAMVHNLDCLRDKLSPSCSVMAVVKANGYGHGLVETAEILMKSGVHHFGVTRLDEALTLRQIGFTGNILLMAGARPDACDALLENRVTLALTNEEQVAQWQETLAARKATLPVHLKIDSGMNRLGVPHERAADFARKVQSSGCFDVQGIFSHLANSDDLTDDFVFQQRDRFFEATIEIEKILSKKVIKHLANSDAVFRDETLHFDMVRVGIALYGFSKRLKGTLRPVLGLKSKLIEIKHVDIGDTVGYDRYFRPSRPSIIGIVPLGYADGFSRAYAGSAAFLQGREVPIVGRICMDLLMVDLTTISANDATVGKELLFIGELENTDSLSAFEFARKAKTTHYEVLTSISPLLPRRVLGRSEV